MFKFYKPYQRRIQNTVKHLRWCLCENSQWLCLCVCVCVCVCMCKFILFHLLASSDNKTSVTYLRYSDQRSFVVSIARGFCQVLSSPYLKMSYFTSKDKNSSQQKLERKRYYILMASENMICIDIGYKSVPT